MVLISDLATKNEIRQNNTKVLKKRKSHFINDFKTHLEVFGFVWIFYTYLQDLTIIVLIARSLMQSILMNPFPPNLNNTILTKQRKKLFLKVLFYLPITMNLYIMLLRLLIEDYQNRRITSLVDGFQHGGLTLQLIGETVCRSVSKLLFADFMVLVAQFFLFALCYIETIEEFEKSVLGNSNGGGLPVQPTSSTIASNRNGNGNDSTTGSDDNGNNSISEEVPEILQDNVEDNLKGDGYSNQITAISISPIRIIEGMWNINSLYLDSEEEEARRRGDAGGDELRNMNSFIDRYADQLYYPAIPGSRFPGV